MHWKACQSTLSSVTCYSVIQPISQWVSQSINQSLSQSASHSVMHSLPHSLTLFPCPFYEQITRSLLQRASLRHRQEHMRFIPRSQIPLGTFSFFFVYFLFHSDSLLSPSLFPWQERDVWWLIPRKARFTLLWTRKRYLFIYFAFFEGIWEGLQACVFVCLSVWGLWISEMFGVTVSWFRFGANVFFLFFFIFFPVVTLLSTLSCSEWLWCVR